jgi:hypothetical protein
MSREAAQLRTMTRLPCALLIAALFALLRMTGLHQYLQENSQGKIAKHLLVRYF